MLIKRVFLFLLPMTLAATVLPICAQVVPSATAPRRNLSITVGGMSSVFQPDYAGAWTTDTLLPVAGSGSYPLFGVGAYVDLKYNRWIQAEAEARWLRYNQYTGISQNNFLVGPRVPIRRIWKANLYGKALIGTSRMTFDTFGDHGTFTTIAFGGGADINVTKRLSLRFPDIEYQYYPKWGNSHLTPYGASVGIGYKIF